MEKRRVIKIKKDQDCFSSDNESILLSSFEHGINKIIQDQPIRALISEEKKFDCKKLENLLIETQFCHIAFDDHFENASLDKNSIIVGYYRDAFARCLQSSSWYLNETEMNDILSNFLKAWMLEYEYSSKIFFMAQSCNWLGVLKSELYWDKVYREDYEKWEQSVIKLHEYYFSFIKHLRKNYPEIDLDSISDDNKKHYYKYKKELS